MPKSESKSRILYIYRMLMEQTDSEHYLTVQQIISQLEENGISAFRKHAHKISYNCGAIEETTVKDDVVKILEGTQPAFYLRNKKYSYYGDKAVTT